MTLIAPRNVFVVQPLLSNLIGADPVDVGVILTPPCIFCAENH